MSRIVDYLPKTAACPHCGAVIEYTKRDLDTAGGDRLQCPACHGLTGVVTRRPTVEETYRNGQLVSRIER